MNYVSTRGEGGSLPFADAMMAGLATDGGLFVPDRWPSMTADDIAGLAGLSYVDTATAVCRRFIGPDIDDHALRRLVTAAYAGFDHPAVVPLVQLDDRHFLLELFHGPTLAFKDVALQLLGQLFERSMRGRDGRLTIVGATSGDTGAAAIHALAGREGVDLFMLHPRGRVSEVQRRQMTSAMAPNIHNIAIEGTFDDAQAIVKQILRDPAAAARLRLGAVNSINWARLMAQIVYYFHAAVRLGAPGRKIAFSVPTGNFGDVFAGYVAARMGLPIDRLIVATNANDIVHRGLTTGRYAPDTVVPTDTPAMDIQVSSNFERLLFDLSKRDGRRIAAMMADFETRRSLWIPEEWRAWAAQRFTSFRIEAEEMRDTMQWAAHHCGQLLDPHSAVGLAAARRLRHRPEVPIITLATAHPAKFPEIVEQATGIAPQLPARWADLLDREERFDVLPNDSAAIWSFICDRANA
ncbi:MAG: threonine synthase [Sphingomonadales bacterium]|nr:threonine synthase [Sphingomonadales bacterium]